MTQIIFTIEKAKEFKFRGGSQTGVNYSGDKFKYTDWDNKLGFHEGDTVCWEAGSDGYIKIESNEYQGKTYYRIGLNKGNFACVGKPADPQLDDVELTVDASDWLSGGPTEADLPF